MKKETQTVIGFRIEQMLKKEFSFFQWVTFCTKNNHFTKHIFYRDTSTDTSIYYRVHFL